MEAVLSGILGRPVRRTASDILLQCSWGWLSILTATAFRTLRRSGLSRHRVKMAGRYFSELLRWVLFWFVGRLLTAVFAISCQGWGRKVGGV